MPANNSNERSVEKQEEIKRRTVFEWEEGKGFPAEEVAFELLRLVLGLSNIKCIHFLNALVGSPQNCNHNTISCYGDGGLEACEELIQMGYISKHTWYGKTLFDVNYSAILEEMMVGCLRSRNDPKEVQWQEKIKNTNREQALAYQQLSYAGYLRTDHWQEVRTASLIRSRFSCQICQSTEKLQTHHRTYERLGEERPEDVITLCCSCHQKFHSLTRGEK